MSTGLCLAKFEGFVSIVFVLIWFLFFNTKKTSMPSLLFLILLLPLLWILWVNAHSANVEMIHFHSMKISLEKLFILCTLSFTALSQNFLILSYAVAFLFLLPFIYSSKWTSSEKFLGFVSIGMVLFSNFANITMPVHSIPSLFATNQLRLFQHATPSLILLWACLTFKNQKKLKWIEVGKKFGWMFIFFFAKLSL